jgi:hypothetical protein
MGNTSSLIKDKTTVSFIIEPIIYDKNNKEHYKNKVKILKKSKSQIKFMVEQGLSELGSNYENSINHYTAFKVKKLEIKNNGIHVQGNIKKNKKQKDITENEYKNHIKSEVVRVINVGYPISTKYDKNIYDIYFKSIKNILFKTKTKN